MFNPTELDTKGKVMRVLTAIVKFILLLLFLYIFICSLDVLSSAFQLVGGEKGMKIIIMIKRKNKNQTDVGFNGLNNAAACVMRRS